MRVLGELNMKVIKLKKVIELTSLSSATIYRLVKNGEFPKQLKLAERSSGWLLDEINDWLESKSTLRNGGQL
jgi:prophage regulatory protein